MKCLDESIVIVLILLNIKICASGHTITGPNQEDNEHSHEDLNIPETMPDSYESTDKSPKKAITLSYSWFDSLHLADRIEKRLSQLGYDVWMDKKDMKSDMYQSMGAGVESCDVFLMFVSPSYSINDNCRNEAEYAADLKKKIVPIKVLPGYRPTGWLAVLQAGKMFYDFSNENWFDETFDKLLLELQ